MKSTVDYICRAATWTFSTTGWSEPPLLPLFFFSGDVLDLRLPPLLFQYVLRFRTYRRAVSDSLADPGVSLLVLSVALALGVVALCVQTVVSKSIVFVDSGRVANVLYAYVGIFTGIYTTVLLLIRYGDIPCTTPCMLMRMCYSLIRDSCHRPLAIVSELVLLGKFVQPETRMLRLD